jgi:hypothetical protein
MLAYTLAPGQHLPRRLVAPVLTARAARASFAQCGISRLWQPGSPQKVSLSTPDFVTYDFKGWHL